MRTTLDLPPDVHEELRRLAFERRTTLSKVAAELLAAGLARDADVLLNVHSETGVRTVEFGRGPISERDVRAGDDEW